MIEGISPVLQTFLGTLLTWGLTAVGAGLVFCLSSTERKVLDASLGFAAGVMTAASYWSLLAPAIAIAQTSGAFGSNGEYAFIPAVIGFLCGAAFIYAADILMPSLGSKSPLVSLAYHTQSRGDDRRLVFETNALLNGSSSQPDVAIGLLGFSDLDSSGDARRRVGRDRDVYAKFDKMASSGPVLPDVCDDDKKKTSMARILLLIIAITIHNIPEGLAVGVGFGAVGKSELATFQNARNLAVGIGIQNFPEGLAVSLPLKGAGFSSWRSFWYGQLSGVVEPIAGLLGAVLVNLVEPLLPYALAFAAGAMIYVVVDDIIPEANACGNGRLASWGAIAGFTVMMALDVGLA